MIQGVAQKKNGKDKRNRREEGKKNIFFKDRNMELTIQNISKPFIVLLFRFLE